MAYLINTLFIREPSREGNCSFDELSDITDHLNLFDQNMRCLLFAGSLGVVAVLGVTWNTAAINVIAML